MRSEDGALSGGDTLDGSEVLFGRAWSALLAPGAVERREGDRWIPLDREQVLALPLRDAHALRDLLLRTGAIAPEPDDSTCRNCGAPLPFDPRELDPRELERRAPSPLPALEPLALPAPVRLPRGGVATHVTMEPVALGEAMPLLRALASDEPYRVTPRLLAAMGVRALGELHKPVLLARVLGRASDEAWAAIERRYLELNAPPPVVAPLPCPRCGAMHEVEVPAPRELDPDAHDRASGARYGEFPDVEAFEATVESLASAVYEARGIAHVALRVEPGVPATDLAGEPLLGSYEPRQEVDAAGYTQLEFLVTVYYRTFRRMWEEDGPYDLEAEIRETIDHELEHHLHHLAGHDPMDEAERAEARQEVRALYGDRRLARLAVREAASDVGEFLRATWPFLLLVAAGVAIAAWVGGWR